MRPGVILVFFFQAEGGIRDLTVTGVQTCALPIFAFERPGPGTSTGNEFGCALRGGVGALETDPKPPAKVTWGAVLSFALRQPQIGRASCRERCRSRWSPYH